MEVIKRKCILYISYNIYTTTKGLPLGSKFVAYYATLLDRKTKRLYFIPGRVYASSSYIIYYYMTMQTYIIRISVDLNPV